MGLLFLFLTAAFAFFFRDPRRTPPEGEHLLVSPADGKVLAVEDIPSHPELPGPARRVTVFLSLLDVHLVRSPLAATVAKTEYHPGKFLRADRPEAGEVNESNTLVLRGAKLSLVMKESVGVAARRIKSYVKTGQAVSRGEKVGLMYFGSRVELTLPREASVRVGPGQKVRAGESVIAEAKP
ncbi:MAG TPA: phosphatidylserine decarboxylase [Burkholderiales bacterium]|nr:phosphatidylserine decarboxylase [Burkholderiales bacterium]